MAKPKPDNVKKRFKEAEYLLECAGDILWSGDVDRGEAARQMRDAAYILNELAERIRREYPKRRHNK